MSANRRNWASGLYWLGVVMTLTCIALVLFGTSEAVHRFEHTDFPLSWACAGVAVLAFLAAELCRADRPPAPKTAPLPASPAHRSIALSAREKPVC